MRRLVLFDIDGTLVRVDGAARRAYEIALREAYGYERSLETYDFSGRTDPQITYMVLRDAGLSEAAIDAGIAKLWPRYLDELQRHVSIERVHVMPGIRGLLDRLAAHPDVVLGLLTGNIEAGARVKLAPPDLNRYFAFGAFGSDSSDRGELPPIAAARAEAAFGRQFEGRDLVIVGDSIWDVRCGVPYGATTIAVATGVTPASALLNEAPHHVFDTLENHDAVIDAILG